MLIPSPRHTPADLAHWATLERQDRAHATQLQPKISRALLEVECFLAAGPAYVGVSWGKDSVVVADLLLRSGLREPLVWVRVDPIYSPECPEVREAFLALYPDATYHEIVESLWWDGKEWRAHGTLERGFARARQIAGTKRYISGVRAEESAARERRVRRWGASTERTCAPLARWTASDVFAYLYSMRLPIHPAYAMTMGGRLERGRIRVSSLGMTRGDGRGKYAWESTYYADRKGLWQTK